MDMSEDEKELFRDVESAMADEMFRSGHEVVRLDERDVEYVMREYNIRREYAIESLIKFKIHLDEYANHVDLPMEVVKVGLTDIQRAAVLALNVGKTIGIHFERGDYKNP